MKTALRRLAVTLGMVGASRAIDRLNDRIGRAASWLALVMVLIGAYNALARHLEGSAWYQEHLGWRISSNAFIELQWYLFSLLFLLAAAQALKDDRHVRVDVLYGRLSERARAWVDLLGTLVFLLPFCIFALVVSWPSVANSFRVREVSPDPGGLPRYPIKAFILVAFALLFLQGVSEALKRLARLRGMPSDRPRAKEGIG